MLSNEALWWPLFITIVFRARLIAQRVLYHVSAVGSVPAFYRQPQALEIAARYKWLDSRPRGRFRRLGLVGKERT